MNANIFADPTYWDASPQGHNGTVGNAAIYSAAFGYNYLQLISADIEYIYRPSYSYSKFQTSTANTTSYYIIMVRKRVTLICKVTLSWQIKVHGAAMSDSLKVAFGTSMP